jgi:hypothetical protein
MSIFKMFASEDQFKEIVSRDILLKGSWHTGELSVLSVRALMIFKKLLRMVCGFPLKSIAKALLVFF